jgi:hypothetical protein
MKEYLQTNEIYLATYLTETVAAINADKAERMIAPQSATWREIQFRFKADALKELRKLYADGKIDFDGKTINMDPMFTINDK